jgi:hypothetical protein
LAKYQQASWLAAKIVAVPEGDNSVSANTQRTELQYALWRLMTPGYGNSLFDGLGVPGNPTEAARLTAVNAWLTASANAAEQNGGLWTGAGWSVFTPITPCLPGTVDDPLGSCPGGGVASQEILIYTPEASSASILLLNAAGLAALIGLLRKRLIS